MALSWPAKETISARPGNWVQAPGGQIHFQVSRETLPWSGEKVEAQVAAGWVNELRKVAHRRRPRGRHGKKTMARRRRRAP